MIGPGSLPVGRGRPISLGPTGCLGQRLAAQTSSLGRRVGGGGSPVGYGLYPTLHHGGSDAPLRRLLGERQSPPYLETVDDLVGEETAGQKTSGSHGLLSLSQLKGRFALVLGCSRHGKRGKPRRGREGAQGAEPRERGSLSISHHLITSLNL